MDCSILTLIACFSWSNLYVDGGLSWQDRGWTQVNGVQQLVLKPNGEFQQRREVEWTMTNVADNPYGWLGVGYVIEPVHNFEINFRIGAHKSSMKDGNDRGIEYAGVDFRWFFLKRRR